MTLEPAAFCSLQLPALLRAVCVSNRLEVCFSPPGPRRLMRVSRGQIHTAALGCFPSLTASRARLRQADRGGTGAIDFSEFLSAVVGNLVSLSA